MYICRFGCSQTLWPSSKSKSNHERMCRKNPVRLADSNRNVHCVIPPPEMSTAPPAPTISLDNIQRPSPAPKSLWLPGSFRYRERCDQIWLQLGPFGFLKKPFTEPTVPYFDEGLPKELTLTEWDVLDAVHRLVMNSVMREGHILPKILSASYRTVKTRVGTLKGHRLAVLLDTGRDNFMKLCEITKDCYKYNCSHKCAVDCCVAPSHIVIELALTNNQRQVCAANEAKLELPV